MEGSLTLDQGSNQEATGDQARVNSNRKRNYNWLTCFMHVIRSLAWLFHPGSAIVRAAS